MNHIMKNIRKILSVIFSIICLVSVIFLVIFIGFFIRDRVRFDQMVKSVYKNKEYIPGRSVDIHDEDYISGINFSKNLEYDKAEKSILKALDRITDKNSPEYAKISQSIGVLYLLMYRYEEASKYLMDSYISFRYSFGEEEENTIVARCLIAYCDCLNGNSEQAYADLDDIFWSTNQPEILFIAHLLSLKALNERGQYKQAYNDMLLRTVALEKTNFVPEEFQSPVLPDVSLWNYHEILGDIYTGLECYLEARSQYLIAGELSISNEDNLYESSRLITKVAQTHLASGGDINDSIYLLKENTTLKEFLETLLAEVQVDNNSSSYYLKFELPKDLARTFRLAGEKEDFIIAMNILTNNFLHFEIDHDRYYYLLRKEALMEFGHQFYNENEFQDAVESFSMGIDDLKQLLLEEHADTALFYYMKACCHKDLEEYELAYSSAKRALAIYEKSVGRNTPKAFDIFCVLAVAEGKTRRYDDALDHIDYAMDLATRYYGADSKEYTYADQLVDEIVNIYVSEMYPEKTNEKTDENS